MWVIMIGERYTWREIESPMDYSTLRRRFWSYWFVISNVVHPRFCLHFSFHTFMCLKKALLIKQSEGGKGTGFVGGLLEPL
jgi:hypothetical protein